MSAKNPRFSLNGDGQHPEPQPDQRKKQAVEALDKRFKVLNQLWVNAEASLKEIPIPVDVKFCYAEEPADGCSRTDPRVQATFFWAPVEAPP
jgi:hypothetical protein